MFGQPALFRSQRRGVPLLAVHVVDRDEGRLAAHGQPDVAAADFLVHLMAQRLDPLPLLVGVGQGDPRVLVNPRDRHLMDELDFAGIDAAGNRRGRGGFGRGGQRDMAFAGEQAGSRVEADPAGAGQIDLGPGVEIGEVLCADPAGHPAA